MTTELVPKTITPSEVFIPNGLDSVIAGVKAKKAEFDKKEFDMGKESDRKKVASFAYQIARSKTFVDDKGKEYVAKLKKQTKEIDAERKRFRDILDELKDEVRQPVTEWEEAEAARIEAERQHELFLMDWDEALAEDDLFNREREMARKEAEFAKAEEYRKAKEETERMERERLETEARIKKEASEKAEREAAEKIRLAEEARARAEEKAEEDRLLAEREAKEAAERAEREMVEAVERAKAAAIEQAMREKAEADRIAAEKKAEEDRRAANKRHQAHVNKKAMASLVSLGHSEETAKKLVIDIAQGRVEFVSVNY